MIDRVRTTDLRTGCNELPERERHVLYAHFGMTGRARTLRDIATELLLSVERVRQIEEAALTELRDGLSADGDATTAGSRSRRSGRLSPRGGAGPEWRISASGGSS